MTDIWLWLFRAALFAFGAAAAYWICSWYADREIRRHENEMAAWHKAKRDLEEKK